MPTLTLGETDDFIGRVSLFKLHGLNTESPHRYCLRINANRLPCLAQSESVKLFLEVSEANSIEFLGVSKKLAATTLSEK